MSTERKVDVVMNLMYNLLLAVVLSAIAEAINAGGVSWPALGIDTVISYALEMFIALCLPFTKWGLKAAMANAKPGSVKFGVIMSGVTSIPFAALMSAAMSFIGIKMAGLPTAVWGPAFLRVWPVFTVLAWACAYFLIPHFTKLARKIVGAPAPAYH